SRWPYAYGAFADGTPIWDPFRKLYLEQGDAVRRFGNPFETSSPNCYRAWLLARDGERLPPALRVLYGERPALARLFPDPAGKDRTALVAWCREHVEEVALQSGLPVRFLQRALPPAASVPEQEQASHSRGPLMEPQVASRRPVFGPLVSLVKRGIRKVIRWYV